MAKKLTKRDIQKYQKTIGTAWKLTSDTTSLDRTFTFTNFVEAFMFVTRIGVHAEVMHLYPHIEIDEHIVSLSIRDESAKGLTPDHFELAAKIDVIYALSTTRVQKHRTYR